MYLFDATHLKIIVWLFVAIWIRLLPVLLVGVILVLLYIWWNSARKTGNRARTEHGGSGQGPPL